MRRTALVCCALVLVAGCGHTVSFLGAPVYAPDRDPFEDPVAYYSRDPLALETADESDLIVIGALALLLGGLAASFS